MAGWVFVNNSKTHARWRVTSEFVEYLLCGAVHYSLQPELLVVTRLVDVEVPQQELLDLLEVQLDPFGTLLHRSNAVVHGIGDVPERVVPVVKNGGKGRFSEKRQKPTGGVDTLMTLFRGFMRHRKDVWTHVDGRKSVSRVKPAPECGANKTAKMKGGGWRQRFSQSARVSLASYTRRRQFHGSGRIQKVYYGQK